MSWFRRSSSGSPSASQRDPLVPVPDANGWYGRRFRTPTSVEQCERHLRELLTDGDASRVFAATWTGGDQEPDVLFGVRDTDYGVVYVAIWQSGAMVAREREVMVVPTRFDGSVPLALPGYWKQRDHRLTSIGHVQDFPVQAQQ